MKINFETWWQRIIITFFIALVISITLFVIKEKPFSNEEREDAIKEVGGHAHPSGTPAHED